ncbi:MAG: threonine synthase, partial [Symploca sp. SIO2G7]|nr:threonine synthase [Symploca sp. SIO2G7]
SCRDKDTIDIFILHPHNRTSEIQRKQMTTVLAANVYNIALKGPFDDCQTIVKGLFGDLEFRDRYKLSAVNSINWARIMAQVVYYVYAALTLGAPERSLSFAVPTGNFGNVFAAYVAKQMGLPICQLAVGTNKNDILTRFFETGEMRTSSVSPSISPSMDIQISSNFERLLFETYGRDAERVAQTMEKFQETGIFSVPSKILTEMRKTFVGGRLDDEATAQVISDIYHRSGELIDPHTAVACAPYLLKNLSEESVHISLACAHPSKFPSAVKAAVGISPKLPDFVGDLFKRQEQFTVLDNQQAMVKAFVEQQLAMG